MVANASEVQVNHAPGHGKAPPLATDTSAVEEQFGSHGSGSAVSLRAELLVLFDSLFTSDR